MTDIGQLYISERSIPEPNSGCWLWLRCCDEDGYGTAKFNRRQTSAHRLSYTAFVCDPADSCVLHKCDNRLCVNPAHLELGGKGLNNKQRAARGRNASGAKASVRKTNKLSAGDVSVIKCDERSQRAIANDYGVGQDHISRIKSNKHWGWVQ